MAVPSVIQVWNSRWLPGVVSALLACASLNEVARLLEFGPWQPSRAIGPSAALTEQPSFASWHQVRESQAARIAAAHLFGAAPGSAPVAAPRTRAGSLTLAGVLAFDDPAAGWAILGQAAGATHLYKVGQQMPDGGILREVHRTAVLVAYDGRVDILYLPRQAGAALAAGPPLQASTAAVAVEADDGSKPEFSNAIADAELRRAKAENPGFLANVMRVERPPAGSKDDGVRVFAGQNAAAFRRLGLDDGELLVAVGGQPVSATSNIDDVFSTLGGAREVRVTISRKGRRIDLILDLSTIASPPEDSRS
jgi:general secretion pathway protein C